MYPGDKTDSRGSAMAFVCGRRVMSSPKVKGTMLNDTSRRVGSPSLFFESHATEVLEQLGLIDKFSQGIGGVLAAWGFCDLKISTF